MKKCYSVKTDSMILSLGWKHVRRAIFAINFDSQNIMAHGESFDMLGSFSLLYTCGVMSL